MFARVTLFEIDTLRLSLDDALERFKELVIPEVQKQKGYKGMHVLRTPEGKGLIMSLWVDEESAKAGVESGYYADQIAKFLAIFRAPAGRDHYEVVLAEAPGEAKA
jgi:heme-degrading monooxygenase HmoA